MKRREEGEMKGVEKGERGRERGTEGEMKGVEDGERERDRGRDEGEGEMKRRER